MTGSDDGAASASAADEHESCNRARLQSYREPPQIGDGFSPGGTPSEPGSREASSASAAFSAGPPGDVAGFVLAGGQSTRMGGDKALVQLAGRPLIGHALAILRDAGLSAAIAGARSSLTAFGRVVEDAEPGLGPLAGVCAALESTAAPWIVFLSIDLPFLPASLVSLMVHRAHNSHAAVTVASVGGFPQTFPAVVGRASLPALRCELAAGRLGCFAAFAAAAKDLGRPLAVLPAEMLAQSGQASHPGGLPAALWFLNVNAPVDLVRAERLLARGSPSLDRIA